MERPVSLDRDEDGLTRPGDLGDPPSRERRAWRDLGLDDHAARAEAAHLADVAAQRGPVGRHRVADREDAGEAAVGYHRGP